MRTSNAIERINQEIKRRTRVASLLRLVTALLCGTNAEWLIGKISLNMKPTDPPQS